MPLSARLTPPKPIAFDNHTHFPLTETNGTRQGEKVLKVREQSPKHPVKTGKSYCVRSDFHFFVCLEMKRNNFVTSMLIEKSAVSNILCSISCRHHSASREHSKASRVGMSITDWRPQRPIIFNLCSGSKWEHHTVPGLSHDSPTYNPSPTNISVIIRAGPKRVKCEKKWVPAPHIVKKNRPHTLTSDPAVRFYVSWFY